MATTTYPSLLNDRHTLLWSQPLKPQSLHPLPAGITRNYIPTKNGNLELLSTTVSTSSPSHNDKSNKPTLLFQHGGFGCASVWIPYLTFFSNLGYRCYAVSSRGHGESWKPSFLRMVWGYGKADFSDDLDSAVAFIRGFESVQLQEEGNIGGKRDLVLIGHSAGGGLVQYFLGREECEVEVKGLVIIAGFPCFGGWGVYWNWFKMDPWFVPRYYIRDLWHSRSPLSSTTLVHNAFFSAAFPREQVREFEKYMPEYESMLWPLGMMFPFVNVANVVRRITGWNKGRGRKRLLVVAGENDMLMKPDLMWQMVGVYRKAVEKFYVTSSKNLEEAVVEDEEEEEVVKGEDRESVGFEVVRDSGHHLQNDIHWEEGAEKIAKFLSQL